MKSKVDLRALFSPIAMLRSFIASVAMGLAIYAQWAAPAGDSYFASEWLRDRFIAAQAGRSPDDRIAIIDIDEASLAAVGPWPWPRKQIAALVENLLGPYEARGVALDLIFPEPADPEGDMRLAMLSQHGPVVLAQAFDYENSRTLPLHIGALAGASATPPVPGQPMARGFIGNHAGLARARHVGNIGFIPDKDGTIRRLPMWTSFEDKTYPTLSLALFDCCAGGHHPSPVARRHREFGGLRQLTGGECKAQSTDGGILPKSICNAAIAFEQPAQPAKFTATEYVDAHWRRLSFSRDWSAYAVVPASGILHLNAPSATIKGRLVLVGSSSLGLTDRVATPLSPSTAGVLAHAAALSMLLDEQAGTQPARWPGRWIATIFSIALALLASYTFPRLSALSNTMLLAGAFMLWLGLAYWIHPHDAYFAPAGPLASILFLLAVAVPFDWQVTQRQSQHLLGTLRQYVADAVVDELLRRKLKDPLAPEQRHVTTLIADLEGYTTHVESLPVEEAAQLTRDFLDCLTRPVLARQGTLDKYTGDGLVAFWGAPLPMADHADLALDAAQDIVREVERFSQARQQAGKAPLRVRIGVESGIAMAGNFGTSFRSIYTAVGDSVNVASRLEQVARNFPHDIIVGPGTAGDARRHRLVRLDEIVLRGKEKPTALFTLESMT